MRSATRRHRGLAIFLCMAAALACMGAPAQAQSSQIVSSSATTRLSPALPLKRDEAGDEPGRAMLVWGIVVLGAVAAAVYVTLRRTGRLPGNLPAWGRASDGLRRRAHLQLSQQASVHVVQWDGAQYMLGVTAHQVTLLEKSPVPPAAAPVAGGREEDSA